MTSSLQTIKDWPEDERPREKLLKHGSESLSHAELLAIILRTGDRILKKTALDHARELLTTFGGLQEISSAGIAELCEIKGIGPVKAATIMAACELGRRIAKKEINRGDTFNCSEDIYRYFHATLRDRKKESFITLLLDAKNRVIKEVKISDGCLTSTVVHPREVFKTAIKESAAAIVLIHNHPSGDPSPSREDIELTKRLKEAGELVGIKVLDHVIIGDGKHVSLAELGYMR